MSAIVNDSSGTICAYQRILAVGLLSKGICVSKELMSEIAILSMWTYPFHHTGHCPVKCDGQTDLQLLCENGTVLIVLMDIITPKASFNSVARYETVSLSVFLNAEYELMR
ncbi:hypothetical protein CDAR_376571 [Caerostris darwini]|uniref:Uncharacterized protein n=1 Tax=Caerostris darwini TaxID=1538125 RepID=A0AAV4RBL3_9ARAC|nr:hypothetical protein CDAR_376571 [Caerostris darwini]